MGMVGPDEPRYADVGRAMAQGGDWITPHLWGQPWFEKPALLYWMTATGFKLGLGPDLAPRLPVALLSVAFLAFFWWRLRIEWGVRTASYATAMLATSAGWLTYSHVAVTDLPLAAFFSAAVLLVAAVDRPRRSQDLAGRRCLSRSCGAGEGPCTDCPVPPGFWLRNQETARLDSARSACGVFGLRAALVRSLHDAERQRVSAGILRRAAVRTFQYNGPAACAAVVVLRACSAGPAVIRGSRWLLSRQSDFRKRHCAIHAAECSHRWSYLGSFFSRPR